MSSNNQKPNASSSKSNRYKRIGVLWKRQTADNRGYLSGRLTMSDEFGISKDYSISIWPSRNKVTGDNNPDYVIDMDTENVKNSPLPKRVAETKPVAFAESNSEEIDPESTEKSTKSGESLL